MEVRLPLLTVPMARVLRELRALTKRHPGLLVHDGLGQDPGPGDEPLAAVRAVERGHDGVLVSCW